MRPPPAEAHYAKPEGAAGFAMKSFVLPLAAGAVAIICVLLIGHQHGGHLFCLSHPLRLPFVLAKKAIKRCSRGDGEHQKAGSAISALVVLEAGVASAGEPSTRTTCWCEARGRCLWKRATSCRRLGASLATTIHRPST